MDEIRLSNQNLPDELYDKILRHLKFKYYHEKKYKNIIFDCLPVSLKNSLICEMYKPIIKKFIFFKNFQNTDFIVRVILAFRPIIADRNDILINDKDMVEDIMFVRRGILSVEMPINITNLEENIDKYKNMSILNDSRKSDNENEENSPIIKYNSKVYNSNINKTQGNNIKETFPRFNSILYGSGISPNLKKTTFGKKVSNTDKEKLKDEIIYVRIFCIRQNEHFGDVMMFLEQRSPLRIRVKSKQAQLFFLRKMDAIKISTSYPNIWRSINKKSIYNFKQIKRSINKIIEIYTSEQKIKEEEDKSSSFFSEIINKGKN